MLPATITKTGFPSFYSKAGEVAVVLIQPPSAFPFAPIIAIAEIGELLSGVSSELDFS